MKTKTVLTKTGSTRQSGRDNGDPRRRDAIPNARHDSKLRPPILLGDPMEFYTRMPPAARQETPVGEHLGAGLRTPASASYEEHDYDNRGLPYRYKRHDHNHASSLNPGGNRGSGRQETLELNFSEITKVRHQKPQSDTGRPQLHHGTPSQGERTTTRECPRQSRFPSTGRQETKTIERQRSSKTETNIFEAGLP